MEYVYLKADLPTSVGEKLLVHYDSREYEFKNGGYAAVPLDVYKQFIVKKSFSGYLTKVDQKEYKKNVKKLRDGIKLDVINTRQEDADGFEYIKIDQDFKIKFNSVITEYKRGEVVEIESPKLRWLVGKTNGKDIKYFRIVDKEEYLKVDDKKKKTEKESRSIQDKIDKTPLDKGIEVREKGGIKGADGKNIAALEKKN